MKRLLFPLLGLALLVATVAQVKAMRSTRPAAPTAASGSQPARISAEGRIVAYPGAEVTVASDAAGTIDQMAVKEKDFLRKGDVVAFIKANDLRAAAAEAKARVAEADADIRLLEIETARAQKLWQEDVGSKQMWEKSERDLDAARARRESTMAELRRLEAIVDKTVITAPIDGVVIARYTDQGESVATGQSIVTIADLKRMRVEAEVDEFDAARITLGAVVYVTAEGYDGRGWRGTIEEIPDAVTSRRLKPQDTSKPIDTHVLLVKVAMAEPLPLKLGQRVEVKIDTH